MVYIGDRVETGKVTRVNPSVLVTLPVHNEFPRLRNSVREIKSALDASDLNYTLSICEDGSDDGTKELLGELKREYPDIIVYTFSEKMGRGWALRNHWRNMPYDTFVFCDADLATGPTSIISAIRHIDEGYDLVLGSRYVSGSTVRRPPVRKLVSKFYNRLLRWIFEDGIYDHQCGLKALSHQALGLLLPLSKEDSWFWDTEIILLSKKIKLNIMEMPVGWIEKKAQRTKLIRLIRDIVIHGAGIVRMKGDLHNKNVNVIATNRLNDSFSRRMHVDDRT